MICDACLSMERSMKQKMGPQVPSRVGNVGEKLFIDLVTISYDRTGRDGTRSRNN